MARPASGDPDLRGSFWGKLLARNKFWEGRRVDILTGYLDADTGAYDPANFIRRTYVIEAIAGPDRAGKVSLVAKDPLKFADSNRARCGRCLKAANRPRRHPERASADFLNNRVRMLPSRSGDRSVR